MGQDLASRSRQRAEQRRRETERSEDIGRQCQLEVLAVGVGQQREGDRPEARCVVHEHVETAKAARDLQRDGIDVFLLRDVTHDAVSERTRAGDLVHPLARAGDKRHARAAAHELADQREPESGRAAGNRDADAVEAFVGIELMCHDPMVGPAGAPCLRSSGQERTCPKGQSAPRIW